MQDKLKVNDYFKDKNEVLSKFGFKGEGLQPALWRVPSQTNRFVWIAHSGDYASGRNTLHRDGERFDDQRNSKLPDANNYWTTASEGIERLLFVRTTRFGQNAIMFAGVFVADLERSKLNVCVWQRVSSECSLPDGSWLSADASK